MPGLFLCVMFGGECGCGLEFVESVIGQKIKPVFLVKTTMRQCDWHLRMNFTKSFCPKSSCEVILIDSLITKPPQSILGVVGAMHDNPVPLVKLGFRQIANRDWADNWHRGLLTTEWGQTNKLNRNSMLHSVVIHSVVIHRHAFGTEPRHRDCGNQPGRLFQTTAFEQRFDGGFAPPKCLVRIHGFAAAADGEDCLSEALAVFASQSAVSLHVRECVGG